MESDELVEVFSTNDSTQAEILRAALRSEGIAARLEGERQAGITGSFALTVKILVRAADADRAQSFIRRHGSAGD